MIAFWKLEFLLFRKDIYMSFNNILPSKESSTIFADICYSSDDLSICKKAIRPDAHKFKYF